MGRPVEAVLLGRFGNGHVPGRRLDRLSGDLGSRRPFDGHVLGKPGAPQGLCAKPRFAGRKAVPAVVGMAITGATRSVMRPSPPSIAAYRASGSGWVARSATALARAVGEQPAKA